MSPLDVRAFTVGPLQENSYIIRAQREQKRGVIVDPGEESQRLLAALEQLEIELDAILVTHCHFDHIGAVAPIAQATGAPVYCPRIESPILADITNWAPSGFGPFESHKAEHLLDGGERLSLAGLDFEVLCTPGHSPGHLTYALAEHEALFSGDVLFQGSVGRVDLPGGDWATLEHSIGTLLERFTPTTTVYPGHMGITKLGRERDTNPFLVELRDKLPEDRPAN